MDSKIFEQSLKLAEQFQKDVVHVPKLFDSMLESLLPNVSNEDKVKLQTLVKESNKLIEDARKTGDFVKIKQSIDDLTNKYGRDNNT